MSCTSRRECVQKCHSSSLENYFHIRCLKDGRPNQETIENGQVSVYVGVLYCAVSYRALVMVVISTRNHYEIERWWYSSNQTTHLTTGAYNCPRICASPQNVTNTIFAAVILGYDVPLHSNVSSPPAKKMFSPENSLTQSPILPSNVAGYVPGSLEISLCVCVRLRWTAAGETKANSMTDLLQVAGEVGKAVESLVTIMTDEDQPDHNEEHGTSSQ